MQYVWLNGASASAAAAAGAVAAHVCVQHHHACACVCAFVCMCMRVGVCRCVHVCCDLLPAARHELASAEEQVTACTSEEATDDVCACACMCVHMLHASACMCVRMLCVCKCNCVHMQTKGHLLHGVHQRRGQRVIRDTDCVSGGGRGSSGTWRYTETAGCCC